MDEKQTCWCGGESVLPGASVTGGPLCEYHHWWKQEAFKPTLLERIVALEVAVAELQQKLQQKEKP